MSTSLDSNWGALSLPIPAGSGDDLTALDPARDILLALLKAALNYELAAAWTAAAAGTGMVSPVGDALPAIDDLETMRQRGTKWPLLAVARSVEAQQEDEFTLWQNRITCRWTIDYVLGPLDVGNQLKLGDVLSAAARVIAATIRNGGHKAYATTPGPNLTSTSKQVLFAGTGCCGFSSVAITSFIQGSAAFAQGGPKYHALTMTLSTTELDSMATSAGSPYLGAEATLDGGAGLGIDTAIPLQHG